MSDDGVLVVNPLPWEREVSGRIHDKILDPRGVAGDETAARHFQDRDLNSRFPSESAYLPPTRVPGFGCRVVPRDALVPEEDRSFDERATVETDRYRLRFDRETGGIERWYDKARDREWVDASADWPLAGFVHERVADAGENSPRDLLFRQSDQGVVERAFRDDPSERGWQPDWHATRRGAERVTRHRVYETPSGYEVRQRIEASGIRGPIDLAVHVPFDSETVVVEANWTMGSETHPASTYLAFPFAVDDPTARLDIGGHAMRPGRDQVGDSCHDYYTAQQWVDVSGANGGVTVGCPLNPLVQFGDFHFGDNRTEASLSDGLFLGWVTNNYWDVNFRAHQPGPVRARYHLRPHDGFDEARAHRIGMEAAHWDPLAQTLGEGTVNSPPLAPETRLLDLPEPPVLVLQVRQADAAPAGVPPGAVGGDGNTMCVLLRNASDRPQRAEVNSAALRIQSAERSDILGSTRRPLAVEAGAAALDIDKRETAMVRITCTAADD